MKDLQLTTHFNLSEFEKSATATAHGIDVDALIDGLNKVVVEQ